MLRNRVRREILDAYLTKIARRACLLRDATYISTWQPVHGKRNRKPTDRHHEHFTTSQDFLIGVAEGEITGRSSAPVSARKPQSTNGKGTIA